MMYCHFWEPRELLTPIRKYLWTYDRLLEKLTLEINESIATVYSKLHEQEKSVQQFHFIFKMST